VWVLIGALLIAATTVGCGRATSKPGSAPGSGSVPQGGSTQKPGPAPTRPNIVFVLTDDLADNLVTPEFMPNLWALEHDGADFTHYFVTDSLCCPSRASIFTGRYPHDTGVFTNTGSDGGINAFNAHGDQSSTVATDLERTGYRTAMMGKYLNRYEPKDPPAPGWDEWDVTGNQGYSEFNFDLNENGRIVHYGGANAPTDNYLTDVLSERADNFIKTSAEAHVRSPFFLEVATYAPHSPYTPAPRYADLYPDLNYPRTPAYDRANVRPAGWLAHEPPLSAQSNTLIEAAFRKRAQSVRSVDDMIGRLVATLKSTGVWANTYLVFSSDNGYHMGEHRLLPGKLTAFDTDINVPLIVVGPRVPHDKVVASFAENIDLRPTFDAWAATMPNEAIDGRSLEPVLAEPTPPTDWPQGALIEHRGPVGDPNDPDYPALNSGNPTSYEALRLEGALYVEYKDGEREWYNLVTDPYELRNTYGDLRPAFRQELHAELVLIEQCHDAPACSDITLPRPLPASGRRA
jgi:N-acetylglucosamine-6-sulfatase